jgi:hypothetical protein
MLQNSHNIIYNDFIKKIELLKQKSKTLRLYNLLTKIIENVSLEYAQKYLFGYLEYKKITFVELFLSNSII